MQSYKDPDYMKKYRKLKKEQLKENTKKYRLLNAEKIKEKRKQYREKNKEKISSYQKEWWKKFKEENPQSSELKKNDHLKKYGIDIQHYEQMLFEQNGVCAICLGKETHLDKRIGRVRSLAVDHNHTTGKVRGLLCSKCNRAVGLLNDSKDNFKRAIEYLETRDEL